MKFHEHITAYLCMKNSVTLYCDCAVIMMPYWHRRHYEWCNVATIWMPPCPYYIRTCLRFWSRSMTRADPLTVWPRQGQSLMSQCCNPGSGHKHPVVSTAAIRKNVDFQLFDALLLPPPLLTRAPYWAEIHAVAFSSNSDNTKQRQKKT